MKIEILSIYEVENYPELWEYLDLEDDDYFNEDRISFYEGDPDMINIFGYTSYFFDVKIKDIHYVIVSDDVSEVENYLETFFSDDFKQYWQLTEPNDWDSFWHNEEKNETIAYRGGSGYMYTIHEFKNEETK